MVIAHDGPGSTKSSNLSPLKRLSLNSNYGVDSHSDTSEKAARSPSGMAKSPTPPVIRRLKSSLKLSKSQSSPSVTTSLSSSSSQKNVRFAAELTTVKKFDSTLEPISISNENSPRIYPLSDTNLQYSIANPETLYDNEGDCCATEDGFWFNESSLLPSLQRLNDVKRLKKFNNKKNVAVSKFQLDYDSDSGLDDDDEFEDDDFDPALRSSVMKRDDSLDSRFLEVIDWRLINTNVCPFKHVLNPFVLIDQNHGYENQLFDYLQGLNIRLHTLRQSKSEFGKIVGLIYVNNLNFEKFIEVKLTFNGWKDIHYITANFSRSVTNKIDEFKFVIDLNSLKYALQVKSLIYAKPTSETTLCPLNIDLCCRYDVNNETFYDNNNYDNYQVKLIASTRNTTIVVPPPIIKETPPSPIVVDQKLPSKTSSFARDFLVSTTLSHKPVIRKNAIDSRKFSDDTDYYNTSPLKHLFHNDTSLIRPVRLNQVLMNPDTSTDEEDYATPEFDEIPVGSAPILAKASLESQNSTSSFSSSSSGGYSPLEDFTSMATREYCSIDSMSSMDMANYNYHLPIFNTMNSHIENHEDGQSVITDVLGDHTNNRENSTDTLINPNFIPRPMSSASTESASLSNSQQNEGMSTATPIPMKSQNSTPEVISGTKDQSYQAFLSSYCFYNSPSSKGFDKPIEDPSEPRSDQPLDCLDD